MTESLSNTIPDGHASDLAGGIFDTQKPGEKVVQYAFPPNYFVSKGSKTVLPTDVTVLKDPNGQSTILFGRDFSVLAFESIHIEMTVLVTGGNTVNPWIHEAQESGTGAVWCEQQILPNANGQAGVIARSVVQGSGDAQQGVRYAPTSTGLPVWMVIVIHLEGGKNGKARMRSLGTHVNAN